MKNNPTQLELFDLRNQEEQGNPPKADPLQLAKVRGCQKVIFQLIAFIFVGLVSFSLGVEKGRKPMVRLRSPLTNEAISAAAVSDKPQNPGPDIKSPTTQKDAAVLEGYPEAQWTIQVASILRSENVKKELARLENKGYSAFGLVKGKYTVICVGKFAAKDHAQNSLAKLKTRYPDCQIRKL